MEIAMPEKRSKQKNILDRGIYPKIHWYREHRAPLFNMVAPSYIWHWINKNFSTLVTLAALQVPSYPQVTCTV